MTNMKKFLAAALVAAPLLASAQAWPTRPIKAVVPFPPGAQTDLVARAVLERVAKQLGQPIVIENKPGGGTTIGEAAAAHSDADGYTLLVDSNNITLTRWTFRNLSYDASRDLVGVTPLVSVPMVVVTSPESGLKTVGDLVRAAKAKPDSVTYASAGPGGATHFGAERVRMAGGFTATHIPYKGSGEAIREVVAGRVTFHVGPLGLALPQMKAGKLVALAASSSHRSPQMPELQTTVEAGLPDSSYDVWIGLFVPAKTPKPIVQRLAEETRKAMASPEVKERLNSMAMDELSMGTDEFATFMARESEVNHRLVQATGFQAN